MSARKRACAILLLAGIIGWPAPVSGWGPLGHRVAARLAEPRLSAAASAAVRNLLDPGESFVDAALWADSQRNIPHSALWHFVNVPITETKYNPAYCPRDGCVVGKIADFKATLRNPRASRAQKQVALRFLIHAIQDVHQPLHVGGRGDRGGNDLQVRFFGQGANLHQVWDWRVLERHARSEDWLVRELEGMIGADGGGTETEWADESLTEARLAYLQPGSDRPLAPGASLGRAYYVRAVPVVRKRLVQAGLRVAAVLNSLWP